MNLRRVGLVVHAGRSGAVEAADDLIRWFRERGITTRGLEGEDLGADEKVPIEAFGARLDLVLSVGGDGTLVRAAPLAATADVPVRGVNVGRLASHTEL